jgi:hypothetical protein
MKRFELSGSKVEDFSPEVMERKESGCCSGAYDSVDDPH